MRNETARAGAAPSPPHRLALRVYYEDTDAGGVVYYANYLKFCERARTEWLRELGTEQLPLLRESHTAFVVRRVEADYLAPAHLDDALDVYTRVTRLGRAGIDFAQDVMRGEARLFRATVAIACIDLERQRPVAMPGALHLLLKDTLS